ARARLSKEVEVEVDELVARAIERTGRGARGPAAARRGAREQDRVDWLIRIPGRRERGRPVGLDAVHVAEDPAIVTGVRVLSRLAIGGEGGALRVGHRAGFEQGTEVRRVTAEERICEQQDQ